MGEEKLLGLSNFPKFRKGKRSLLVAGGGGIHGNSNSAPQKSTLLDPDALKKCAKKLECF